MKKVLINLLAASIIGMSLVGCGSDNVEKTKEPGGTDKKYAIIVKNTGNPYNEKQIEGFKEAVGEFGGEVIVKAPEQPTAEIQIQMIEEVIAQGVDVIAIAGNDPDGLQPALKKAMDTGIKVLSFDSAVNKDSRQVHINQADPEAIGRSLVKTISDNVGGTGDIAILTATSQATNQNLWIEWMKKELEDTKYKDINLVKVAYGDDLRDKSVSETEALLKTFPNLKGIISPTTVGVAAAGKVLTDKGLKDKVVLTGLGLPSEMADYIDNGICKEMFLWNPIDIGYLTAYSAKALVEGKIDGSAGGSLSAGRLGDREIITADGGTEIMLGEPFKFDSSNIGDWKTIY